MKQPRIIDVRNQTRSTNRGGDLTLENVLTLTQSKRKTEGSLESYTKTHTIRIYEPFNLTYSLSPTILKIRPELIIYQNSELQFV